MLKVYGDIYSGNCYKIRLLAAQLGIAHEWRHVDILQKQTRTPEFLAKNPNGRIPLLQLDSGECLAESNAILHYLAEGSALLPADRLLHAQVLQWMFFEQYSHEPYIATSRYIIRYLGRPPEQEARLLERVPGGKAALAVMDRHLQDHTFFVGARYSIADIALYAYTHVAHEGGFDLEPYVALRAWLARVASQPCYAGMDQFDTAIRAAG
ncbi:MAG TPA: glutathione S-transferase family protein [Solimonas sp.]|nr:glutathione S-transferase family protein [Solimonas sp.]